MSYFSQFWIVAGEIVLVETDTSPITQNHAPDVSYDVRIIAEVDGPYEEAASILGAVSWNGENLVGLAFVSQDIIHAANKPEASR